MWCCECDIFDPVSRLLFTLLAAPQQILSSWPDRNILYISNIGNLSNTHSTMNLSFSARPLYICPCTDPLLITIGTNVLGARIVGVCTLPHLRQLQSAVSCRATHRPGPHKNISITLPRQFSSSYGPQSPESGGHITNSWHGADTSHSYHPPIYVSPL